MKRYAYITLITIALVLAASSVVLGAATRIVVLDLNTVINESDAGKAANAELAALVASKQAEVDEMWAQIESFSQELDEQSKSLTDEENAAKQEELEGMVAEYEQAVADADAEVQTRAEEMRNQITTEIAEVLRVIGAEEGYDLILDTTVVHFYSQLIDITWEVIRKYNYLRQSATSGS